jgi:sulfur carrier protein
MKLTVNGDFFEAEIETVGELISKLRLIPERVAVEVNLKLVKKKDYDAFSLREGDSVEIVNFVGGG